MHTQRVGSLGRALLVAPSVVSRGHCPGLRRSLPSSAHSLTAIPLPTRIVYRTLNLDSAPSPETSIELLSAREYHKRLTLRSRALPEQHPSGSSFAGTFSSRRSESRQRFDPSASRRSVQQKEELRNNTRTLASKSVERVMANALEVLPIEPDPALDASSPSEAEADSATSGNGAPSGSSIPILDATAVSTQRLDKKSKIPYKKPMKRKYLKPSAASGGVPKPKVAYLQQAQLPPTLLSNPRRILVVIDLNGTLLYRPNRRKSQNFIERPYARTFLDYCIRTFAVAIWSSARPANVALMLNQLVSPDQRRRLVAIWGRDTLGLSPEDYQERVQVYKRLEVLWAEEKKKGREWNQTNTVLVDDSKEKARTEPFNIVQLPEFDGDRDGDEGKYVLPQVHDYLNQCAQQADVSCFVRTKPFVLREGFKLGCGETVQGI